MLIAMRLVLHTGLTCGLLACGAGAPAPLTPVRIQSEVVPAPVPVCTFAGTWSGNLRFDGTQTHVSAPRGEARLFADTLEAHVSGGGWHLEGHTNLGEDHVLRLQHPAWLGEGVAVNAGLHVSVDAADQGRVHVAPHPAAVEDIVFTEPPGRWLPCADVGLLDQPSDPSLEVLSLPMSDETLQIGLPFTLAHLPGAAPFAEIRRNERERANPNNSVSALILERQGDYARIRVSRYGGGSRVILVGWVSASLLGGGGGSGTGFGSIRRSFDHERCRSSETLSLFIEGDNGRVAAGHIDAGTLFRVNHRDDEWAQAVPLGGEITIAEERRFFVANNNLTCTTVGDGTHTRQTHQVRANVRGLACGTQCDCELRIEVPRTTGICRVELQCGAQVVFGDQRSNGYLACEVHEGRVSGTDPDPSQSGSEGDPRLRLDGDIIEASDEAVGRYGAFRLEGRILR